MAETDAPYLTPQPFRGKRNEPAYTKYVVEKIAQLLGKDTIDIENLTTTNAKRLFKAFAKWKLGIIIALIVVIIPKGVGCLDLYF